MGRMHICMLVFNLRLRLMINFNNMRLVLATGLFSLLIFGTNTAMADQLQQCLSGCSSRFSSPGQSQLLAICSSNCNSQFPSSSSANTEAAQKSVGDQQSRQVIRQISSMISGRIAGNVNPAFNSSTSGMAPAPDTSSGAIGGASADGKSWLPDSMWTSFAWSRLSSNGSVNMYNADIYQAITGIDKNFGNFYLGTTVNYAGATDHIGSSIYGSSHTVGITPYIAYAFNKNFFISGLSGYNYSTSNFRGVAPDSEMDAYMTEFDLNALETFGKWYVKGKTGARYLHTFSKAGSGNGFNATQNNLDSWTYLLDVEGGYAFENGLRAFSGILYENLSPASVTQNGITYNSGNNIFYYSAGADYMFNKKFTLGTKIQTDLNNTYTNLTTISLNARLVFE